MAQKSNKKLSGKQLRLARSQVRFNPAAAAVLGLCLVVLGYFVVRVFAATAADNPYVCNAPYPTIQKGSTDSTGGRTDKCVSAVQWAIGNLAPASWPIWRPAFVDGDYASNDAGTEINIGQWKQNNGLQSSTPVSTLYPNEVAKMAQQWPFKTSPAPQQPAPPDEPGPAPEPTYDPYVPVDTLPQLDAVSLGEISDASPAELEQIIDDATTQQSTTTDPDTGQSTTTSESIARSYSGKLRIMPPEQDVGDGADQFRYYVNGKLKATSKKRPYAFIFDTTRYKNGKYALTIVSYVGGEKLYENSYGLTIKNNLTFWQKVYNVITAPFAG